MTPKHLIILACALVFLGTTALATAASAASVTTGTSTIPAVGGTVSVPIVLDSAPNGLIGAEYTVTLSNAAVADITGFTAPSWSSYTLPQTFPGPTTTFTVRMVDFSGTAVPLGATNVNVGTLTLTGLAAGTSAITITPSSALGLRDRDDNPYSITTPQGTVTVSSTPTPTPSIQPSVADFSWTPATVTVGLPVLFKDQSSNSPNAWWWVLNGESKDTKNVSYTFATPGTYAVTLLVKNAGMTGWSNPVTKFVTVNSVPSTTTLPISTTTIPTTTPTPFGSNMPYPSAHNIPCRIEAEDYDVTIGYPAYSDTTAANYGGAYRTSDAVDIGVGGTNYYVGWINPGEFLSYSVDSALAGTYTISFRVSNPDAATTVAFKVNGAAHSLTIPATGSLNTWQTVTLSGVSLNAGRNIVKVDMGSASSFNFDYMDFATSMSAATITTGTFTIPSIGGTVSVPIVLNSAQNGLIGAEYTVTLSNAAVADITGFTSPSWSSYTLPQTFPGPTTTFTVRMVDLSGTAVPLGATNVNIGTLTLKGKAIGTSNIVITPSAALGIQDRAANHYSITTSPGTVTVSGTPPTVTSITPNSGTQGSTVEIGNLLGTGFKSGATVRLTRTGSADIIATNVVVVSPSKISCQIALPWTAEAGVWNVVVTNSDGLSATRTNGFTVTAIPPAIFRFAPSSLRMPVGTTTTTTLYLDGLTTGFSGIDATLTLSLPDATVGEIVGVALPGWAITSSSTLPADTVSIRAVDLNNLVGPGGNALIGTITVRGENVGQTELRVTQARVDDEVGNSMPIVLAVCTVDVTQLPAIPGGSGRSPQDLDSDGRYEDINGNDRADFADIVLYFNQMTWISENEPLSLFDYNSNGRIDFADVVWLFHNI